MKQLTLVTCFYLPLTFLTVFLLFSCLVQAILTIQGYFGMNFETFFGIQHSDSYV